MIDSAEIQNFRGFRGVTLKGLSRVNILVGDNGAGKTALLEALFLASSFNADIALRFRQWRGVDAPGASGNLQEIYDGIFLDIFHGFDRDSIPTVNLKGNANDSSSLRIYYDPTLPTVLPFDEVGKGSFSPMSGYTPITFEWKDASGRETKVTPRLSGAGLQFQPSPQPTREYAFLAARTPFPTSQNARWFSEFSKWGREKRFIATVRAQFGYVESLSVEVDMGNPVIFVKVPWLERKMPIYLASDGLNKLVTLLLHVSHCEKRAVFVDEVENGFHYTRHKELLGAASKLCRRVRDPAFLGDSQLGVSYCGGTTYKEAPPEFCNDSSRARKRCQ
jgi:hypothetical protein